MFKVGDWVIGIPDKWVGKSKETIKKFTSRPFKVQKITGRTIVVCDGEFYPWRFKLYEEKSKEEKLLDKISYLYSKCKTTKKWCKNAI